MHTNHSAAAPLSRREALRCLAALTSGAALLPFMPSASLAADAPAGTLRTTTEPTGNPNIDKNLAAFEFAPMTTTRLTESLGLLSGPGGNMAVLVGPDGALLVDTGVHPAAPNVAGGAEAFAAKTVTLVVNTHWHFDHTGGNEFFGRRGTRIVAHDNVRARMGHEQFIEAFGYHFPPSPAPALPVLTFPDALTLYFGNETIHLQHFAPAHTDGDILVHFANANVLHLGDTFFNGFYPFIDYSSDGWLGGMVAAADKALALCDDKTRIIPGHGPLGTPADLKAARDMLATVQSRIEKGLESGKSAGEIAAAAPTREFDEKWGKGFLNGEAFTRLATTGIQHYRQKKAA